MSTANAPNIDQQNADLSALRERHESTRLALEIAEMRQALRTTDPMNVTEAWGELIDPREFMAAERDFGWQDVQRVGRGSSISDREHGSNAPLFRNESDLSRMRASARWLATTSPTAIAALEALSTYVLRTGFNYRALGEIRRRGRTVKTDAPTQLVDAVQDVLDDFLDDNDFDLSFETELFQRWIRDGELYLAHYPQAGGQTALRTIEPEQNTEPANARRLEDGLGIDFASDWRFGVHTVATDAQDVRGYYVQWNPSGSDWDYLTTDCVEHAKRNVDRKIKRGISDFYAVEQWLERVAKLLRNTNDGATVLAAIAMIRQHAEGKTQSSIQRFADAKATGTYQKPTDSGLQTANYRRYEPGTIIDTPQGQTYTAGPLGQSNAPNYIVIEQAVLRMVGSRWSMPEYLISGDASNANYASTLVAESPFVGFCQRQQVMFAGVLSRSCWRAIRNAANGGRLREYGISNYGELKKLVDIQVEPPAVVARDPDKETTRHKMLNESGILSEKTWSDREGLDREQEIANGAKRVQVQGVSLFNTPQASPSAVPESTDPGARLAHRLLNKSYP